MLKSPNQDKIQLRNDPAENKNGSGVFTEAATGGAP